MATTKLRQLRGARAAPWVLLRRWGTRRGPFRSWKGPLLLTDLLPALPCACSAGSASGSCGAIDSEVPVATREIQRRKNQEEGCPSVDAVGEADDARGGRNTATGD